jgi:hypothetical protein
VVAGYELVLPGSLSFARIAVRGRTIDPLGSPEPSSPVPSSYATRPVRTTTSGSWVEHPFPLSAPGDVNSTIWVVEGFSILTAAS